MRLRRVQNRVYKGKEYERWLLTVPPDLVSKLGWDESTELEAKARDGALRLVRKAVGEK